MTKNQLVIVVDYGMGNLKSVANALQHVAPAGTVVKISGLPADIDAADRVVLPGQGAMPDCMKSLRNSGAQDAVLRAAETKPLLGVCVGEQMLLGRSDEGKGQDNDNYDGTAGLGLIAGRVRRFPQQHNDANGVLKVPHMGWNQVFHAGTHPVLVGIASGERFYFVHSYYAEPDDAAHNVAQSDYGFRFCAAIARDNIFATQFHPEKSAAAGLMLYKNFLNWQI